MQTHTKALNEKKGKMAQKKVNRGWQAEACVPEDLKANITTAITGPQAHKRVGPQICVFAAKSQWS